MGVVLVDIGLALLLLGAMMLVRPTRSLLEEESAGWCRATTETWVFSTDAPARRAFAAYWRVIYQGSAWIRRMWLQAIRRRAEHAV